MHSHSHGALLGLAPSARTDRGLFSQVHLTARACRIMRKPLPCCERSRWCMFATVSRNTSPGRTETMTINGSLRTRVLQPQRKIWKAHGRWQHHCHTLWLQRRIMYCLIATLLSARRLLAEVEYEAIRGRGGCSGHSSLQHTMYALQFQHVQQFKGPSAAGCKTHCHIAACTQ